MFAHEYIRNAFIAGTAIAAAAGLVGYFVVLRSEVFTGDALSHVSFTGALGALALGIDARVGLYAATVVVAVALGLLARRGRADDVVIGVVFAWVLGVGVLFLSIYTRSSSAGNGAASVAVLFGSIFGISGSQARATAAIAVGVVLATMGLGRPLLFSSVDAAVAAARGVPVRLIAVGFLAIVGVCAALATQAVGALLLLGLLAAPAAAAMRLSANPMRAMWVSVGLAVAAVWLGLTASYVYPRVPPSFAIIAAATAFYAVARLVPKLQTIR